MEPLVSVVLPTHNRPDWLAEALRSVLDGEFGDFEVVVSNNGDPAHTRKLAAAIRDTRVRWIEQPADLGMLPNFLAALSLARGEYVAVLHDDDWWSPRFLGALVPPLERHPETVLAFADHFLVNEHGDLELAATDANTLQWGRANLAEGLHRPFFGLVARQSVAITGCVFRRSALPVSEVTPEVGSFYDSWTTYLLARTGGAAYFTRERLLYYRSHDESHSSSRDPSAPLAAAYCRRLMWDDPGLLPYRSLLKKQLGVNHESAGGRLLRQGARGPARAQLAAAIRLHPSWRAAAGWAASWVAPRAMLARL
jgi:glycosyltransferase involved in cell wall biosynthesis